MVLSPIVLRDKYLCYIRNAPEDLTPNKLTNAVLHFKWPRNWRTDLSQTAVNILQALTRPISRDKALYIQNLNVVCILSLIRSASQMAHYEPSHTFNFRDFSFEQNINIIGEKNLLLP